MRDLPRPEAGAGPLARVAAWAQGAYFVLTGAWPILHIPSFEAITGPKTDDWLVETVGATVAAVGVTLLLAARRGRVTAEIRVLAILSAIGLGAIDVVYVSNGTLRPVYLLDAAVEAVLVLLWLVGWRRED
jgi:energy-converting hydrogenase Eha subunit E